MRFRTLLVPLIGVLLISVSFSAEAQPYAQPGDVIVSDDYSPTPSLFRLDPRSLAFEEFLPGFRTPIDFDAEGNLVVFDGSTIVRLKLETGETSPIYAGPYSAGLPFNAHDYLLLEDDSILATSGANLNSKLWKLDASSQSQILLIDQPACLAGCSGHTPRGMALAGPDEIFLVLSHSTGVSLIRRVSLETEESTIVAQGGLLDEPRFIRLDSDGSLLVSVETGVVRVDPESGQQAWVLQDVRPWHFDMGDNGLIYLSHLSTDDKVSEMDPDTGAQRVIGAGLPASPRRLAVVPGRPAPPACRDGVDNDGDGMRDWPRDPGCTRPDDGSEETDCSDGIDNDGDGLVDAGEDPGCRDAGPLSQERPACSDGIDNDGDGYTDHPQDPECMGPYDNREHWAPRFGVGEPLPTCGLLGIEILPVALLPSVRRRLRGSAAARPR